MNTTGNPPWRHKYLPKMGLGLLALCGLLFRPALVAGGELTLAEYQVKALFLLNFTKYVDWPAVAFAETNTPIRIGICGEDKFGEAILKTVEGKTIAGRRILVQPVPKEGDSANCHILFISDSEKPHLDTILSRLKTRPVLTVGESDNFLAQGGVINFVKKESKIRLEINLDAARQAQLQISSRLLGVADVVKGRLN